LGPIPARKNGINEKGVTSTAKVTVDDLASKAVLLDIRDGRDSSRFILNH